MSSSEIKETVKRLEDEIESSLKQMRSIAHIQETSMNFTKKIRRYIDEYLNHMEDIYAGRLNPE